VSRFAGDGYGRQVRTRFADDAGFAELAMLGSPSIEELEQLRRAVAIMTPREKAGAALLTDSEIERIAGDARVDPALFAIFVNGYMLHCKRVS